MFASEPSSFIASSKVVRKSIAVVHTVAHAKQRNALKLHYKKQKYTPLDLRAKKVSEILFRELAPIPVCG